jgi:general L-amino acid transport system permease protein
MTTIASAPMPVSPSAGPLAWARANLFSGFLSSIVTVVLGAFVVWGIYGVLSWAIVHAVWSVDGTNTQVCRDMKGIGACWALIAEKHRFILFGTYPYEHHLRPTLVIFLFIALYIISSRRRFWNIQLLYIWIVGLALIGALMWGGFFGMPYVEDERWGGLPVTLILATFAIAVSFPVGILLALGRRSDMPAIKALCVVYIELIRGVPLLSLLIMASVMLPLFLPEGLTVDKLLRAQIAFIMFVSAYLAEVIRGGLQAIPKGQYEAADALGLSYWKKTGFIILPQALRLVIPPMVNIFIAVFKDTSLVLVIGIFDLMTAAKNSTVEPAWRGFGVEVYVFVSLIYFMFCFSMSRYSQRLEADLASAQKR